jgi:two-component system sensor histidine kinase KdpD
VTPSVGGVDRPVGEADSPTTVEPVEAIGRFRVYLGGAPGVGKTMAMLGEGRRRRERGTDVVIGYVEGHGRPATEELTRGFESVPPRMVEYRGTHFPEMDLDAVVDRHPEVALVDELAHTNVPGSGGNEKRWQDVLVLLDRGIDVITTVNIQHLEGLADAVERIIGAPISERVPDWLLRKANQIELVDSSPEQLRRRMAHGNIYPEAQVPEALSGYFRAHNLAALRELTLRFLADETEQQLLDYLRGQEPASVWETHERILIGVTTAPGTEAIIRRASRMASRIKADLGVLHVRSRSHHEPFPNDRLVALRQLAADVGADWSDVRGDDPAQALIEFARSRRVTQIVIGSSGRSRWQEVFGGGSIVGRITKLAAPEAIDIHIIARRHDPSDLAPTIGGTEEP